MGQGGSTVLPKEGERLHYIQQEIGENQYINIWPPEWEPYKKDEKGALRKLEHFKKMESESKFRLVSYGATKDGYCDRTDEKTIY